MDLRPKVKDVTNLDKLQFSRPDLPADTGYEMPRKTQDTKQAA